MKKVKFKNPTQNQEMMTYKFLILLKILLCKENQKKIEKPKKLNKF